MRFQNIAVCMLITTCIIISGCTQDSKSQCADGKEFAAGHLLQYLRNNSDNAQFRDRISGERRVDAKYLRDLNPEDIIYIEKNVETEPGWKHATFLVSALNEISFSVLIAPNCAFEVYIGYDGASDLP